MAVLPAMAGCAPAGPDTTRIERNFRALPAPEGMRAAFPYSALTVAAGRITVRIARREYDLETLTVTPPGPGPFPLVVISHGVPADRNAAARERKNLRLYLPLGQDFARRGYKAVVFARRGFASSSGSYQEGYQCSDRTGLSLALSARSGGRDFAAVIKAFAKHPNVNSATVVAVGQSGGGLAALALASSPPPGLVGIISFAGGRGGMKKDGRRIRGNCNEEGFVNAFGQLGESATVPALWLYSTTDRLFWPELVDRALNAYTITGAPVSLVRVGALRFAEDGHLLYRGREAAIWRPLIDRFLDAIGAPNRKVPPNS